MNNTERPTSPIDINITTLDIVTCPACDSTAFINATELRRVPRFISKSGKPEVLQLQILLCSECGRKIEKTDIFEVEKKVI